MIMVQIFKYVVVEKKIPVLIVVSKTRTQSNENKKKVHANNALLRKKGFIFVFEISQSCHNAAKTHYYVLISKAFP